MQPSFDQGLQHLKNSLLNGLDQLVNVLFPARTILKSVHEYRIGTHGSISIRCDDGAYFNHETGEGGDILTLIQHALKTDFKGALAFAKGFVGSAPKPVPNLQKRLNERAERQRDKAILMLKRSVSIKDTLAQRYIEEHRRIEAEYVPASLHFLPHAYNHTADGFFPAMIAPINSVDAEVIAAHVTFLDPKTGNKLKGDGIKSRLIFGSCRGGAIRLSGATDRLALCEGIEDGLTILSTTDWPVWVTGGTSNLRSVELPDSIREVLIGADNDQAGLEATQHLAKRLTKEGRMVRIATPPSGYKDFNAMLCGEKHHVA